MKINYEVVETKKVEVEVPDEFSYDDSSRGKVVDGILIKQGMNPESLRGDLFHNNAEVVKSTIRELTHVYGMADAILKTMQEEGYRKKGEQKIIWHSISRSPSKSGKYLVGHRGTQKIMHWFGNDKQWHPNTQMGWLYNGQNVDPVKLFGATHYAFFETDLPPTGE